MNKLELKIIPLAQVAIVALGMWLLSRFVPALHVDLPGNFIFAVVLFICGWTLILWAFASFRRAGTTANPVAPGQASSVVTSGAFAFSRNPMYLGFVLWLLGWAAVLENAVALLLVPAFILYMNRFQIAPEERVLRGKFGEEYIDYVSKVRRWI